MKIQSFKQIVQPQGANLTTLIQELRALLANEIELESDTLNGIVGTVSALAMEETENIARMNMTMEEYTAISPIIPDIEKLLINRALGVYTRILVTIIYQIGQQDAKAEIEASRGRPPEQEQNPETEPGTPIGTTGSAETETPILGTSPDI